MKISRRIILSIILCLFYFGVGWHQCFPAAVTSEAEMVKAIDEYLSKSFTTNSPGVAVLAVKDGKVLLRKGYGMANLELGVAIKPEMLFRIGSITKQFTAAGIMMLVEEGKIALDDEITKFLPDYPTQGARITVHHLLNHTSGIKSYTDMPEWITLLRKDLSVSEIIAIFKDQPMTFKPGERFLYNNSGYILLGAIIEKVSGKSYEAFINERIFKPLGMTHSYYDNSTTIIPNRVAGYGLFSSGFKNADYISMTQPYAAGSLLSSVDDLYTWNTALLAGKVVSQKSLQLMLTQTKLADGKTEDYGYGLMWSDLFGEKAISHGGGIHGFATQSVRVQDKNVFVVVFSNCAGQKPDPDFLAHWMAALLCGKDVNPPKAIKLTQKIIDDVVGVYQIADGQFRTITFENDQLYSERSGSAKMKIFATSDTEFFYENSFSHFTLVRDAQGKVTKMIMKAQGADSEAIKTDKKPDTKVEVKLSAPEVFDAYVGRYESPVGLKFTLRRDGEKYFVAVEGQGEFEVFPMSDTRFFLKIVSADFEMVKDAQGKVTGLVLHQNGVNIDLTKK